MGKGHRWVRLLAWWRPSLRLRQEHPAGLNLPRRNNLTCMCAYNLVRRHAHRINRRCRWIPDHENRCSQRRMRASTLCGYNNAHSMQLPPRANPLPACASQAALSANSMPQDVNDTDSKVAHNVATAGNVHPRARELSSSSRTSRSARPNRPGGHLLRTVVWILSGGASAVANARHCSPFRRRNWQYTCATMARANQWTTHRAANLCARQKHWRLHRARGARSRGRTRCSREPRLNTALSADSLS